MLWLIVVVVVNGLVLNIVIASTLGREECVLMWDRTAHSGLRR